MASSQTKLLYKMLIRSAKMFMPTPKAKEFMIERVKAEFRKNMHETNPIKIQFQLQRAYAVLMNSIDETAKKIHMK